MSFIFPRQDDLQWVAGDGAQLPHQQGGSRSSVAHVHLPCSGRRGRARASWMVQSQTTDAGPWSLGRCAGTSWSLDERRTRCASSRVSVFRQGPQFRSCIGRFGPRGVFSQGRDCRCSEVCPRARGFESIQMPSLLRPRTEWPGWSKPLSRWGISRARRRTFSFQKDATRRSEQVNHSSNRRGRELPRSTKNMQPKFRDWRRARSGWKNCGRKTRAPAPHGVGIATAVASRCPCQSHRLSFPQEGMQCTR